MSKPGPSLKEFNIPESQQQWDEMITKLGECGFDQMKATSIIKEKKVLFDAAVQEWNNQNNDCNDE